MKSKRARVLCYWNMSEVKEEKLQCNMKGRIKNKSMESNKQKAN